MPRKNMRKAIFDLICIEIGGAAEYIFDHAPTRIDRQNVISGLRQIYGHMGKKKISHPGFERPGQPVFGTVDDMTEGTVQKYQI